MRTTVNIQDSLLEKAKKYSLKTGLTMGSVMESALALFFKENENKNVKSDFKLITVKGELVNPDINLDRTSEILSSDDIESYRK